MKDVRTIHEKSMTIADEGYRLKGIGKISESKECFLKAFKLEKQAADLVPNSIGNEPSRSILYKGAAWLALNAGLFREAEIMASQGLIGTPTYEIAQELKGIIEQANFEAHLSYGSGDLMFDEVKVKYMY